MYLERIPMYLEGIQMYLERIPMYLERIPMYLERSLCTWKGPPGSLPILGCFKATIFFKRCLVVWQIVVGVSCWNLRVSWNPKQPVLNGWKMEMVKKTTIFHVKIWNHPTETIKETRLFRVPGSNEEAYKFTTPNVSGPEPFRMKLNRLYLGIKKRHRPGPGKSKEPCCKWLFQWDDSKSLHGKVVGNHQTSIH